MFVFVLTLSCVSVFVESKERIGFLQINLSKAKLSFQYETIERYAYLARKNKDFATLEVYEKQLEKYYKRIMYENRH